jgi:hypothetical protein
MGALHRLTALKAKRLTASGRHADGGGLYLAIKQHGKINGRSWTFLYRCRASGRLRELGLGSASVVSLADARQKAANARAMLAAGVDPLTDRKVKLAALKGARTFGDDYQQAECNSKGRGEACPSASGRAQYCKIRHVRPWRKFNNHTGENKRAERFKGYFEHQGSRNVS